VVDVTHLYLVRHGEVANPNHIVYGDLDGFHLSPSGVLQAHATAAHLRSSAIDIVLTSPLPRAIETAEAIARRQGLTPEIDNRLTESGQFPHWTGHRWSSIPTLFPGELEAYLEDASAAPGAETLQQMAGRIIEVISNAVARGFRHIAVVGHQDALQAARLVLVGRDLAELRSDPPAHAEVISLVRYRSDRWTESSRWAPTEPTV